MLGNQWMLDWGIAWNEYKRRKVVDGLMDAGVVERHDAFNPKTRTFPLRRYGWCGPMRPCAAPWASTACTSATPSCRDDVDVPRQSVF